MSNFSLLELGRLGIIAQGRALSVTSNNIANVNTPGYTRQRAVFDPVLPTTPPGQFPLGGGVHVETIQRLVDATIDAQLEREGQGLAYYETIESGMARIEGVFEELGGAGIGDALQDFYAALGDLSTRPGDVTVRTGVIQAAERLVDLVHDADRRLASLEVDANQDIPQQVLEINRIAANIAELNASIFRAEIGSNSPASQLRDQRGELLRQLGSKLDFTSFERETGEVAVFVAGGFMLVDKDQAGSLEARTGAPGNPAFYEVYANFQGSVAGPVTDRIDGGRLGASIDLRDERLGAYRDRLDEFAFTLARRMNAVHLPDAPPPAAFGLVDDVARRFFVDSSAGGVDPSGDAFTNISGAAGYLAINADLRADPRHLAAGTVSLGAGLGAAADDNRNALRLAQVEFDSSAVYSIVRDPITGAEIPPAVAPAAGNGLVTTLGGFFGSIAGALGAELQGDRNALSQQELIVAELVERRGAVSGVSLDEEVANLMRFEKAYQASARVIQIGDELLEQLMGI